MVTHRKERVGELLQGFLNEEIRRLIDPTLCLITVNAVKMSADLRSARVFWSALEFCQKKEEKSLGSSPRIEAEQGLSTEDVRQVSRLLKEASRALKRRIAEELQLRFIPELIFEYDETLITGMRIDRLLDQLHGEESKERT